MNPERARTLRRRFARWEMDVVDTSSAYTRTLEKIGSLKIHEATQAIVAQLAIVVDGQRLDMRALKERETRLRELKGEYAGQQQEELRTIRLIKSANQERSPRSGVNWAKLPISVKDIGEEARVLHREIVSNRGHIKHLATLSFKIARDSKLWADFQLATAEAAGSKAEVMAAPAARHQTSGSPVHTPAFAGAAAAPA